MSGGQFEFVSPSTRTKGPTWGCIVRVDELTKSRKLPALGFPPALFYSAFLRADEGVVEEEVDVGRVPGHEQDRECFSGGYAS